MYSAYLLIAVVVIAALIFAALDTWGEDTGSDF